MFEVAKSISHFNLVSFKKKWNEVDLKFLMHVHINTKHRLYYIRGMLMLMDFGEKFKFLQS